MQPGCGLNLVENQLHHPLIPPTRRVIQRNARGGDNRLAQKGRNLHHIACHRQSGPRILAHKQRAHGHMPGNANLMLLARRHP